MDSACVDYQPNGRCHLSSDSERSVPRSSLSVWNITRSTAWQWQEARSLLLSTSSKAWKIGLFLLFTC
ncbi:hypothetical protein TcWFU_004864 [Taenia crassiceps]|uniref:Uncharacterized protein n=1 Tax=Taenia crassiceps TaxID=6207 RepID=A0ABR4Q6D7_9CEST